VTAPNPLVCDHLRPAFPPACFLRLRRGLHEGFVASRSALLADDLADHGSADAVHLGDFTEAEFAGPLTDDGSAVLRNAACFMAQCDCLGSTK